jgi:hypothetical protein
VIFPNITLFIYKPQTRVWFVYTAPFGKIGKKAVQDFFFAQFRKFLIE